RKRVDRAPSASFPAAAVQRPLSNLDRAPRPSAATRLVPGDSSVERIYRRERPFLEWKRKWQRGETGKLRKRLAACEYHRCEDNTRNAQLPRNKRRRFPG